MSDETPVPGELAIGDHLAGYRLDEIIARGGHGRRLPCLRRAPRPQRRTPTGTTRGAASGLAVIDVPRALARGPALAGVLASGTTPRQFALEPGGRTLLVVDTGSGQLQALQTARLP